MIKVPQPLPRVGLSSVAVNAACDVALPLTSGCLLAISASSPSVGLVAWAALIPFAAAIARQRGTVELYAGAYLGGVLYTLQCLEFMRTRISGADCFNFRSWIGWRVGYCGAPPGRRRFCWPAASGSCLDSQWASCYLLRGLAANGSGGSQGGSFYGAHFHGPNLLPPSPSLEHSCNWRIWVACGRSPRWSPSPMACCSMPRANVFRSPLQSRPAF